MFCFIWKTEFIYTKIENSEVLIHNNPSNIYVKRSKNIFLKQKMKENPFLPWANIYLWVSIILSHRFWIVWNMVFKELGIKFEENMVEYLIKIKKEFLTTRDTEWIKNHLNVNNLLEIDF